MHSSLNMSTVLWEGERSKDKGPEAANAPSTSQESREDDKTKGEENKVE